ncbi:MAG TPA: PQQ-binding-like beta-propeller repeat protein [Ruania sp.]|nr:PQQ-binding-like beta-propeller repeat protein [Ruania sp.]
MSKEPVHEFTLGASSPADATRSNGPAGPESRDGSSSPDRRRRSSPGWRTSPWPVVILAVLLVVAGAAVSPQGGPQHARPPAALWTAQVDTGRSPGLWVLGGHAVVAEADSLRAVDPSTGEQMWQLPLDDPACAAAESSLTCVAGQGEDAVVVDVDASGGTTEHEFPDADVAARIGTDLLVAGGTTEEQPWLVRIPGGADEPTWRHQPELPGTGTRFTGITISQGVVTVRTAPEPREDRPTLPLAFAADAASGDTRPAVVRVMGVTIFHGPGDEQDDAPEVLPLPGEDLVVDGYPQAGFTANGLVDLPTQTLLHEHRALALYSLGEDVLAAGSEPWQGETPTPDVWLQRVHALTGQQRWRLSVENRPSCPCTRTEDNVVLFASSFDREQFTPVPAALLGVDLRTGQLRWRQPIDAPPDALAAADDQVFLLTGGTLTAYADR